MKKKVYVGMSGGVDSSVTAALLKEQGYDVVGVYMKNWSQDLPGFVCPWKEDYQDALAVAVRLGIDLKLYDFQTEYRQKVVDYMLDEYKAGRTPNPDIMCNQEVKFKLFLNTALEDGADLIATGHYARVWHPAEANNFVETSGTHSPYHSRTAPLRSSASSRSSSSAEHQQAPFLLTGIDRNKDQSYFLYRVTEAALNKTLMPVGEYTKPEVRDLAQKLGLSTAAKKDSQGICFVGKVGIKEFLQQYVETEPGAIINQDGQVIGEHEGAIFYTLGQRHGLNVGGGLPYYVVGKDMGKNEVYVTTDLDDQKLWRKELALTDIHWINEEREDARHPSSKLQAPSSLTVRTRYRAPLVKCHIQKSGDGLKVILEEQVRAVTPGQSAVLYEGDRVLGGGIVI